MPSQEYGGSRALVAGSSSPKYRKFVKDLIQEIGRPGIVVDDMWEAARRSSRDDIILLAEEKDAVELCQVVNYLWDRHAYDATPAILGIVSQSIGKSNPSLFRWNIRDHAAVAALSVFEAPDTKQLLRYFLRSK